MRNVDGVLNVTFCDFASAQRNPYAKLDDNSGKIFTLIHKHAHTVALALALAHTIYINMRLLNYEYKYTH